MSGASRIAETQYDKHSAALVASAVYVAAISIQLCRGYQDQNEGFFTSMRDELLTHRESRGVIEERRLCRRITKLLRAHAKNVAKESSRAFL
jgi:hypothetical protein